MNSHPTGICCRSGISDAVSLHAHLVNEEHLPQLSAVPAVACARRYRNVSGTGSTYLALYKMENEQVMGTEAWSQTANTAWTNKLRPHFKASINLGKRIF